jgi:hypothetical protein
MQPDEASSERDASLETVIVIKVAAASERCDRGDVLAVCKRAGQRGDWGRSCGCFLGDDSVRMPGVVMLDWAQI